MHTFLAEKSSESALRAVYAIRQGVKRLGAHPEIGRPVDDLPVEFREQIVEFGQGAYAVRYRYVEDIVVVLAIRYGPEAGF